MSGLEEYVAYCVARLSGPDRENARHSLAEAGPRALPHLLHALAATSPGIVRTELVEVIAQCRSPEAVHALAGLLRDPGDADWAVALDGVVSIGGREALDELAAIDAGVGPERQERLDKALRQVRKAEQIAHSRSDPRRVAMRADLAAAIESLYEVFDAYPLKDRIDSCPHCELDEAESRLHARPLREMTWADLGAYSSRAMTTFGDEDDFRHFLPRILELYVFDHPGAPYFLTMLFGKLDEAGWTTWPTAEVVAIRRLVEAWERTLAAGAGESEEGAWELEELRSAITAL